MDQKPLSGRRAEAVRNDERILRAAHEVFVADPTAPVSTVAKRAGVGISAIYRRYESKEDLLATLCAEGQEVYIAAAERALADDGDPWNAYTAFLRHITAEDTHARSARLAGTFTPTKRHLANAAEIRRLGEALFSRTQAARAIRPDVDILDVALLLEAVSGVQLGDSQRTAAIRQRLIAIIEAGLANPFTPALPGDPPTWAEQERRWRT